MYIIVRFFSLLFCLFLLKRVAKRERERRTREKQPTATLCCCCCCLNYCTWRGDFSNSLWWRCQFEYEENRIPWKKTFRILSLLTLSYSKLIKRSLLRGASFFRFFRESVVRRITAFRRLYWVLLLVVVVLLYHWRPPTLPPTGRERGERIFVSFFASSFFFLPARKKGQLFFSLFFFVRLSFSPPKSSLLFSLSLFFFCQQSVVFAFFSFSLSSCLSRSSHFFCSLWEHTHTQQHQQLENIDLK